MISLEPVCSFASKTAVSSASVPELVKKLRQEHLEPLLRGIGDPWLQ